MSVTRRRLALLGLWTCGVGCIAADPTSAVTDDESVAQHTTLDVAAATIAERFEQRFPRSFLPFSYRWTRGDAFDADALAAYAGYGAGGLFWHYGNAEGSLFARTLAAQHAPIQCALTAPTTFDATQNPERHCRDLYGASVGAPWLPAHRIGNFLDPSVEAFYHARSRFHIERGCTGFFQQDDPEASLTAHRYGGCFSAATDERFRQFLEDTLTPAELAARGVSSLQGFSYSAHLRQLGAPGGTAFGAWQHAHDLRDEYRSFLKSELIAFYQRGAQLLRQHTGSPVLTSSNIYFPAGADQHWVYNAFDVVMTEASHAAAQSFPQFLRDVLAARGVGRPLVVTLPDASLARNRAFFAMAYALGEQMIAPWDVYAGADRVFLPASAFRDLLDILQGNRALLDDFALEGVYGSAASTALFPIYRDDPGVRARLSGAPRVGSLSYGVENRGHTTLRIDDPRFGYRSFAAGTTLRFRHGAVSIARETRVGALYVRGDRRDLVAAGEPVLGVSFRGMSEVYFAQPTVASVTYEQHNAGHTTVRLTSSFPMTRIARGVRFTINGRTYEQAIETTVGNIYLAGDRRGEIAVGSTLDTVSFPTTGALLRLRDAVSRAELPHVVSSRYVAEHDRTEVRLSDEASRRIVPRGARWVFLSPAGTTYAQGSSTQSLVGLAYFSGDRTSYLTPGTRLLGISLDGAESDFQFATPPEAVVVATPDAIATLRRRASDRRAVIHVVDLTSTTRTIELAIDLRQTFGSAATVLRLVSGSSVRDVPVQPLADGRGRVVLTGFPTWGILTLP